MTSRQLTYYHRPRVLTPNQARARHRAGHPYKILAGDPESPYVVLTIGKGGRAIRLAVPDPTDKHNEVVSGSLLSLDDPPRRLLDNLTDCRGGQVVNYSLPPNALAVRTVGSATRSRRHASSWEQVLLDDDCPEFDDCQDLVDLAERLPALLKRLEGLAWTDLQSGLEARVRAVVTDRRLDERVDLLKGRYREWVPISAEEVKAVLEDTGRRWRVEKTEKARVLAAEVPGGRVEAMILTKYPAVSAMAKFQPGHGILLTVNLRGVRGTWGDTDPRPDPSPGPHQGWLPPFTPPDTRTFAELVAILLDGMETLVHELTERPFELPT